MSSNVNRGGTAFSSSSKQIRLEDSSFFSSLSFFFYFINFSIPYTLSIALFFINFSFPYFPPSPSLSFFLSFFLNFSFTYFLPLSLSFILSLSFFLSLSLSFFLSFLIFTLHITSVFNCYHVVSNIGLSFPLNLFHFSFLFFEFSILFLFPIDFLISYI
ncbi:unnamed protein product [Acanthosepion pharaonis]|uniref:Uncharacterized protein n=1 Tax=Acanthosepion pharaonis TaxID=158019 RepID=A0A812DZX0_ACAPH|nr:unnamed protein product [Sepia pharaonis]